MDYTTIDLTPVGDQCQIGEEVILIGKTNHQEIRVEDWARIKNTHPYDILCSLGTRVTQKTHKPEPKPQF